MNIGKIGEALFRDKMSAQGYKVEDVSNNSAYWDQDIDFIVTSPTSGLTKSFEVKYDSRINDTGNMYLELFNINSAGQRGWYKFCRADYVAYGDSKAQCFYVVPLAELRQRVEKIKPREASCGADSIGLLLALNDIADLIKVL